MSDELNAAKVLKKWEDSLKLSQKMGLDGVARFDCETAISILAIARDRLERKPPKPKLPWEWAVLCFYLGAFCHWLFS